MYFDLAGQLMGALVAGVQDLSSPLTFQTLERALRKFMPLLAAHGGSRAGDASSRVVLLIDDAAWGRLSLKMALRGGGSADSHGDVASSLSTIASRPALELFMRNERVVALSIDVAGLAASSRHLEVALMVLRVGAAPLTALLLGTTAAPGSHPLFRAVVASR
jgi:hypothetical protein